MGSSGRDESASILPNVPGTAKGWGRKRVALASVALAVVFLLPVLFATAVPSTYSGSAPSGLRVAGCECWTVTFTETGLPAGTNWSAQLSGTYHFSNTNQIVVPAGNGTYNWTVPTLALWAPAVMSGVVHVVHANAYVNVTFLRGWAMKIHETGLPAGTSWSVVLNGTVHTTTYSLFVIVRPNGTYTVNVTSPVPGPTGVQYIPATLGYTIHLNGVNVSKTDAFSTQYNLTTSASPTPGGTTSPPSGWFNSLSSVTLGETPAAGYYFIGWTGTGTGSYTGSAPSPTITMEGPIAEVAGFSPNLYAVTFTETGLPAGTNWSVNLHGTLNASATTTVGFTEPTGTYPYSISPVAGYTTPAYSGSVTVSAAPAGVTVPWTQVTYGVTFTESGLATGTSWSVTLNGSTNSSTGSSIGFSEPNGSYSFTVSGGTGYHPSPAAGNVTVNGTSASQPIVWTSTTAAYSVNFTESGLPSGTSWSITLAGTRETSTGTFILFTKANGTYSFTAGLVPGYTATPTSGSVTVSGAPVTQPIAWSLVTYGVSFVESGLPSGTSWSVTLASTSKNSTTSTIAFSEPNGTYSYSIAAHAGYTTASYSGSVTVAGGAAVVGVNWTVVKYIVTFTESGLPAGTSWSVVVNGVTYTANVTSITVSEPNGSYAFSVVNVSGYTVSPQSGTLPVQGGGVSEAVGFVAIQSSSSSNGLTTTEWLIIAVVVILVAAVLIAALVMRRRKKKPEPKAPGAP